ncbi:hypothetical protein HQQ94_18705 [Shewanella sp. VB17]|uniref:hypothetical protein n=1 Tax=Shewanella sp. VB17 TaxID=2739432 RepID=UPI00156329B5|nr:hypothetical protein [Shewanella sp. VB17]NRD75215.1 hypothetical protein [Shewanella sp. VB17]
MTSTAQGSYYASLDMPNNPLFKELKTTWQVPVKPTKYDVNNIFIWNGIGPRSGGHIIQPVLDWNGTKWRTVLVHNVDGNYLYSDYVDVEPGDMLTGFIRLNSHTANHYEYAAGFEGTAFAATHRTIVCPVPYNQLVQCLEPYSTDITTYPHQDFVSMANINAKFEAADGTEINRGGQWLMDNRASLKRNNVPSLKNGIIVTDGINGGRIDFYFR